MTENEQSSRSMIHYYVKKMMDEIDKLLPCKICGKERGIGIAFDADKLPICIGCLNILVDNVNELDDKISKSISKVKQK